MCCRLEPAIWSHDTGQQIPYFDRCQLIITWISDIKQVRGKSRLHVSVNLLLEYGRHVARLHRRRRRRRRRRRAYALTSNTASHGTHEKIISWVPFRSLIWVWGSAWRPSAARAPLICTREVQNESFQLPKALRTARNQREEMYVLEKLDLILLLAIVSPSYLVRALYII